MSESDRGVRAHLLDRHFGAAGRGSELTRHAEVAERRAKLRAQREAVKRLDEVQSARPRLPPGRTK